MIIEKTKKKSQKGFTLVEVMASVMVLSVGLMGSLIVINRNLTGITSEEKRLVAISLAEDGLERARNIRDSNWLSGAAWNTGFGFTALISKTKLSFFCDGSQMTAEGKTGTQSWNSTIDQNGCNGNKCSIFEYQFDSQFFCYSDNFGNDIGIYSRVNSGTEIRRLITAEKLDSDTTKVHVDVRWSENGQFKYLAAEEILYNWK